MLRQEQKYFLNFNELSNVINYFDAFSTFSPRIVNSIYFDSHDLVYYHFGDEGVVPRKKIRFRWYGNCHNYPNKGNLEVKETHEHFKQKQSLPFNFKKFNNLIDYANTFSNHIINPKCQVTYERQYFMNSLGVRFTYDYNIRFKDLNTKAFIHYPDNIFEIKYDGYDKNLYQSVLGDRLTRFSKYNIAILNIYRI
jgi:SPX domain protein involved in polyphosphate accumulation